MKTHLLASKSVMKVKELIDQLSDLPKSYEIVVCLDHLLPPGLPHVPDQEPESISAFVSTTLADRKKRCVYIYGRAVPKDQLACPHGKN
jgi:hypothetical protein